MPDLTISEDGLALIKKFEGFSPMAYVCPAGKLTIGYGHVISDADVIARGARITQGEGERLLMQDVAPAEAAVRKSVTIALKQNQFDALVSLVFNIGAEAFAKSTLLKYLNRGEFARVSGQFMRWDKAGKRPLLGLRLRRRAEAELFDK